MNGYKGIYQRSKVRYLSEKIKNTSPNSVKNHILSDNILHQDFDGCVTLHKDFVKQSSANNMQSLGIAESITNNTSGNKSVTFPPED